MVAPLVHLNEICKSKVSVV